jgi:hypothetical protein
MLAHLPVSVRLRVIGLVQENVPRLVAHSTAFPRGIVRSRLTTARIRDRVTLKVSANVLTVRPANRACN